MKKLENTLDKLAKKSLTKSQLLKINGGDKCAETTSRGTENIIEGCPDNSGGGVEGPGVKTSRGTEVVID
ncbi:hypothetical protein [uncultured Tenacibaculum sp.]|uniref:hypothetical protein n=1 Tax=uncultured Tenacibaculum sp. TaxID=174713 RepID=UPI0026124585|nr:hypothetical protein [uncultured Tenacibaculum sp.]